MITQMTKKLMVLRLICILTSSSVAESRANYDRETMVSFVSDNHKYSNETERKIYNTVTKVEECKLEVNKASEKELTHNILVNRYNFVYLKLNFVNLTVNAKQNVIAKKEWIWTYRGEKGAHEYLYIPEDFGYLSFGLLWAHTMKDRINIIIEKSGNCNNLVIGDKRTDSLIGLAFNKTMSNIASKDDRYTSCYVCYNKHIWKHSTFLYEVCKNWICTFQTITYECCKFHLDVVENNQTYQCQQNSYYYGAIWWILPVITGNICFAFYPLLLTKIGMSVKKLSKTIKKEITVSVAMNSLSETVELLPGGNSRIEKSNYVSLKSPNRISVSSTLFSLYGVVIGGARSSRALRLWIIILPLCITSIKVSLGYFYAKHFMEDAIRKGALDGFSAILTGVREANKHFMYVFGGPVVATSICFLFGFLLIVFPSNLEEFLTNRIGERVNKCVLLVNMSLKLKESLSGINVENYKGCKKLHQLFLAQIYMLIHPQFWKESLKLFCIRWKTVIFMRLYNLRRQNIFFTFIICVIILPFYILFCTFELFSAVAYFLSPAVSCYFIILDSTCIHYNNYFQHKPFILKCIQYTFFIPILILFSVSWYTYSLLFLDGILFLSRIVMLTYSGIVAYPILSYGYLVLALMTFYYITESINAFGESYRDLLKVSLDSCKKFQQNHIDESEMDHAEIKGIRTKYGIKTDLFYFIINKTLPRRNQLLKTILKVTSVTTVLIVSVKLFIAFDKFKELSVVTHVFTVLFICALPKILKSMCYQNFKHRTRHKMKEKVLKTIADYVRRKKGQMENSSEVLECVNVSKHFGYETLSAFGSNNGDSEAENDL